MRSTHCSTSISSARRDLLLSIVVASNGAPGSVAACLESLEGQVDGAEVLVCSPEGANDAERLRFPFARFLDTTDGLVPELWRDGIDAASGDAVALTISPMRLAPDWVEVAKKLAATNDVAAGAIEPLGGIRVRDTAEYFCRYARDMLPFAEHECLELPGDNAVYSASALDRVRDDYRNGFWEAEVNRALANMGDAAAAYGEPRGLSGPLGGYRCVHAPAPAPRAALRPPAWSRFGRRATSPTGSGRSSFHS